MHGNVLQNIALCGDILQYTAHVILKRENVCNTDIAGLILPGGDNTEILPNPIASLYKLLLMHNTNLIFERKILDKIILANL